MKKPILPKVYYSNRGVSPKPETVNSPLNLEEYNFTLKESLVLEVLATRYLLGEKDCIFTDELNPTFKQLAEKKLVLYKYGKTKNTTVVWLTDLGKVVMLTLEDKPSNNKVAQEVRKANQPITDEIKTLQKNLRKKT